MGKFVFLASCYFLTVFFSPQPAGAQIRVSQTDPVSGERNEDRYVFLPAGSAGQTPAIFFKKAQHKFSIGFTYGSGLSAPSEKYYLELKYKNGSNKIINVTGEIIPAMPGGHAEIVFCSVVMQTELAFLLKNRLSAVKFYDEHSVLLYQTVIDRELNNQIKKAARF